MAKKSKGVGTAGTPKKGRALRVEKQRERFLEVLGEMANVRAACLASKLPRRTVYNWYRDDAEFKAKWDAAIELGIEALEDEATRRAVEGVKKPIYQGKELVGHVQEYSDTLLIFLLKGRKPEKYKDRAQVDHKIDLVEEFKAAVLGKSRGLPGRYQQRGR